MLTFRQVTGQTQQLTPQLIFASELLQMSSLELRHYIERELLENPMLEEADPPVEEKPDLWEALADDSDYDWRTGGEKKTDTDQDPFDRVTRDGITLEAYLLNQLRFFEMAKDEREIAEFLIGNLDECGLLTIDIAVVADAFWVTPRSVGRILKKIQTLDPVGVGARDRRECLMIQLKSAGQTQTLAMKIVKDHWNDLMERKLDLIRKLLKSSMTEVQQAVEQIGELNPNPGLSIDAGDALTINPDLIVEYVDGRYVVQFNDAYTPRVRISPAYRSILTRTEQHGQEDRDYVREKLQHARLLVGNIEQRRKTILKVMAYIVETQQDFLEKGALYLKPMTMEEVGAAVGVDGSTVSRAQQGKYVQTPGGILPMRSFFTRTLGTQSGPDISVAAVKKRLEALVQGEDSTRPLSDGKLTALLQREGIEIKRRTVAKYRTELDIPVASIRRKFNTSR